VIDALNARPGAPGCFTETFCERSRFCQPFNGARVDAIRDAIEREHAGTPYHPILLTSLVEAADRVDSTTGIQMAFLKDWAPRSARDLELRVPVLLDGPGASVTGDVMETVDALPDGSTLAFYVQRGGEAQTLSGPLRSIELPPMRLTVGSGTRLVAAAPGNRGTQVGDEAVGGCGRISDFDTAPRQQQLHAAKIISIDGVTPGPDGSKSYRVSAGTHVVKVAEDIESRYLSFSDRARSSGPAMGRYKTLSVDVAPGTTTLIAARLIPEQRNNPTDGAYWEPVAWKQVDEACR
jgi:hypothetical protein